MDIFWREVRFQLQGLLPSRDARAFLCTTRHHRFASSAELLTTLFSFFRHEFRKHRFQESILPAKGIVHEPRRHNCKKVAWKRWDRKGRFLQRNLKRTFESIVVQKHETRWRQMLLSCERLPARNGEGMPHASKTAANTERLYWFAASFGRSSKPTGRVKPVCEFVMFSRAFRAATELVWEESALEENVVK